MNKRKYRVLPAATGWQWMRSSFGLLAGDLRLLLLGVGTSFLWMKIAAIPHGGALINYFILPVLTGLIVAVADSQRLAKRVQFREILKSIVPRLPALVWAGFLFCGAYILSAAVVLIITGSPLLAMAVLGDWLAFERLSPAEMSGVAIIAMLVPLGVAVALTLSFWFLPALVLLESANVYDAIKIGFVAATKNLRALLLFGVLLAGFWLCYLLAMYLIPSVVLSVTERMDLLLPVAAALGALFLPIFLTITVTSTYTAYVAVFSEAADAQS